MTASASRSSAISFYSPLATTNQTARRQIQNFHWFSFNFYMELKEAYITEKWNFGVKTAFTYYVHFLQQRFPEDPGFLWRDLVSQQPLSRHTKNKASYIVLKKTVNLIKISVIILSFRSFVRRFFCYFNKEGLNLKYTKKTRFSGTFYTEMNTVAIVCAQNLRHWNPCAAEIANDSCLLCRLCLKCSSLEQHFPEF